jgi:hypothetical protein
MQFTDTLLLLNFLVLVVALTYLKQAATRYKEVCKSHLRGLKFAQEIDKAKLVELKTLRELESQKLKELEKLTSNEVARTNLK